MIYTSPEVYSCWTIWLYENSTIDYLWSLAQLHVQKCELLVPVLKALNLNQQISFMSFALSNAYIYNSRLIIIYCLCCNIDTRFVLGNVRAWVHWHQNAKSRPRQHNTSLIMITAKYLVKGMQTWDQKSHYLFLEAGHWFILAVGNENASSRTHQFEILKYFVLAEI